MTHNTIFDCNEGQKTGIDDPKIYQKIGLLSKLLCKLDRKNPILLWLIV